MSRQLAHNVDDKTIWRSEDINVTTVGGEDSESEVTFESLGLRPSVVSGLRSQGFVRLSAIQLHAIPLGRCGVDLIVQSKSGTGKTCVFVVIALELLEALESNAVQVLIICPTREIAVQTAHVMTSLASHSQHIRCCAVIGGTKLKDDIKAMAKCQAVVGTPGRIKQLIELNVLKTNSIRLLVLDECDKLLDNNFRQQMDDIFECLPQNKQTIAASATMSTELAHFLTQYMRTPVFVRLNADNPALIGVKQFYTITPYHHLNHINFDYKIDPLIEILKNVSFSQCLVFSNYQTRARMLCDKLNALNWKTTYISAEKCQSERLKAMNKVRKYKCRVLVSTDLTARGIDVQNINLVINMDTPFDAQTYLHRIGRAGRFGTRGIAITIASNGRETELMQKIIKECKLKVQELAKPIPADIWKMDDSDDDYLLIEKAVDCDSGAQETDECNPLDKYLIQSNNSVDSVTQMKFFDDILKDYNVIKDWLLSDKTDKTSSVCCELTKQQTDCDSLVDQNKSNVAIKKGQPLQTSPFEQSRHTESMQPSVNVIQSGFNLWANALFPPMHTIGHVFQYNQWIENNRFLWHYMLNPLQTFQTCNNNQN